MIKHYFMPVKFLRLNDIDAYVASFKLSNFVWGIVIQWDYLAKDTVGKQFIRAIDSISSNIAEGFGRYGKKTKVMFYHYARGSVIESLDWCEKAKRRNLITEEQYNYIFQELQKLPKLINQLISYTNKKLDK